MKIEKGTCGGPTASTDRELLTIAAKTLFRYGAHSCGPYVRTNTGFLDMANGIHTIISTGPYKLANYKELPNAVLYTGE